MLRDSELVTGIMSCQMPRLSMEIVILDKSSLRDFSVMESPLRGSNSETSIPKGMVELVTAADFDELKRRVLKTESCKMMAGLSRPRLKALTRVSKS